MIKSLKILLILCTVKYIIVQNIPYIPELKPYKKLIFHFSNQIQSTNYNLNLVFEK